MNFNLFSITLPPLNRQEMNFTPGTFDYIQNESDRIMLYTAYSAITILNLWNYLKHYNFKYTTYDDNLIKIYNKVEEIGYTGHSGMSFLCTLRDIQVIAVYGEVIFKKRYDHYQQEKRNRIQTNASS
jgi:hypothetical protein